MLRTLNSLKCIREFTHGADCQAGPWSALRGFAQLPHHISATMHFAIVLHSNVSLLAPPPPSPPNYPSDQLRVCSTLPRAPCSHTPSSYYGGGRRLLDLGRLGDGPVRNSSRRAERGLATDLRWATTVAGEVAKAQSIKSDLASLKFSSELSSTIGSWIKVMQESHQELGRGLRTVFQAIACRPLGGNGQPTV